MNDNDQNGFSLGIPHSVIFSQGQRHPYQEGPLGVIQEGAYADMLLVEGNPLQDISLLADPEINLKVIMKDGKIYKNTLEEVSTDEGN